MSRGGVDTPGEKAVGGTVSAAGGVASLATGAATLGIGAGTGAARTPVMAGGSADSGGADGLTRSASR